MSQGQWVVHNGAAAALRNVAVKRAGRHVQGPADVVVDRPAALAGGDDGRVGEEGAVADVQEGVVENCAAGAAAVVGKGAAVDNRVAHRADIDGAAAGREHARRGWTVRLAVARARPREAELLTLVAGELAVVHPQPRVVE